MKKTSLLLALCLLLGCLTGCSGGKLDLSAFTDIFAPQEAPAEEVPAEEEAEEDGPVAPVTEVSNEIKDFGLAYQVSYGLHPYECVSLTNRAIFSFLYEPLFVVTADFYTRPILAEGYTVSDDGLTTTVTLKEGICFSDGSPITAADVVYSVDTATNSAYYGNRFRAVNTVEALDERTVVFTTRMAHGELPLLLDIPIIPVDSGENAVPMGSGPYKFLGSTILVRNENWWQEGPPIVDFPVISLTRAESAADIRDQFEYENVNLVQSDPNSAAHVNFHNDYELWNGATTIMQYIGYNIGSKVYSNYGLRGAVTYAIDREALVTENTGGFAIPAVLPVSPLSSMYDVRLANDYDYDLDKYYARLESASVEDMDNDSILDVYVTSLGYALPVDGTMIVCNTSYQRVQTATAIVKELNKLGFKLELKSMDYEDYTEALLYGNFDLYYGEVRLSPNFDLSPFFRNGGSMAYGQLADSTMDNLCNKLLLNSGNSYDLYKRICDRGYITPVLFKSYAVYTTRGSMNAPTEHLDWFLPAEKTEEQE